MSVWMRQGGVAAWRSSVAVAWLAVGLAVSAQLPGCSKSGDPGAPSPVDVRFSPVGSDVTVDLGGERTFSASLTDGTPVTAVFTRGATVVATSTTYLYQGATVGRDSLRATVTIGGREFAHDWEIWVDGGYGDRPAPVQSLLAVPGDIPAALDVSWLRPPVLLCPRPIVRYLVRLSYGGPIDNAAWEGALALESVAHSDLVLGYQRTYTGLLEGQPAWVAVRAEDSGGVLSPLYSVSARVPAGFQISGRLEDVNGDPLAGLRVSVGDCPTCRVFSQADGSFTLGPFRDLDPQLLVVSDDNTVGVLGDFYDFHSDTLRADSDFPLTIVMIGAHGLASECGNVYGGDFLSFLKDMTTTDVPGRFVLNRWDAYPVSYWVQSAQSTGDWTGALDPLVHAAAAAWNSRCGAAMFAPAADSAAASLVVTFALLMGNLYGQTEITDPVGHINEVVPARMRVTIHRELNSEPFARGLALHELGHATCLGGHSDCGTVHMMTTGGRSVPLDQALADALHVDEVLAARYVRRLPQGQNMNRYLHE